MEKQGRRIEDAALRFAQEALKQPAERPEDQASHVAKFMLAFHTFAQQRTGEREGELATVLKRVTDPAEAIPRVVEKVGQALQLLRQDQGEPTCETVYLSRTMLGDAMRLLGRSELIP